MREYVMGFKQADLIKKGLGVDDLVVLHFIKSKMQEEGNKYINFEDVEKQNMNRLMSNKNMNFDTIVNRLEKAEYIEVKNNTVKLKRFN